MTVVFPDTEFTKVSGKKKKGYFIDTNLLANLDLFKERVKNKYDGCFIVTGGEGSGKSTFAQGVAYYLNPNLNIKNVVFDGKELLERVEQCNKYDVIIYDESVTDMSRGNHAEKMYKTLQTVFTMMRSRQFYIILILPNIFQLGKYFSVSRSMFLLHTYSNNAVDRGYFKFFSFKRKKALAIHGHKNWDMSVQRANFCGRFPNTENFFLPVEEYEKKKQDAIKKIINGDVDDSEKREIEKMRGTFSDYKLKMKISNDKWKENTKTKFEEALGQVKNKYNANKKVKDVNKSLDLLITQLYELENFKYRKINLGANLTEAKFIKEFKQNTGVNLSAKRIKDGLIVGKELIKMGLTEKNSL